MSPDRPREGGSDSLPLAVGQSLPAPHATCPQPADVRRSPYWSAGRTAPGSFQGQGRITHVADCSRGIREPLLSPRTVSLEGTHQSSLHIRIRALPAGPGLQLSCLLPSLHVLLGSHLPGPLQGTQESADAWPPYGTPDMAAPRRGKENVYFPPGDTLAHDPHTFQSSQEFALIFSSGLVHPWDPGSSAQALA